MAGDLLLAAERTGRKGDGVDRDNEQQDVALGFAVAVACVEAQHQDRGEQEEDRAGVRASMLMAAPRRQACVR